MTPKFMRDAISATLALFATHNLSHEVGAEELRKLQGFDLDNTNAAFGAKWRLANSAKFLAGHTIEPVRLALLSISHHGYYDCSATDLRFRQSYESTRAALPQSGALGEPEILDILARALSLAPTQGLHVTAAQTNAQSVAPGVDDAAIPREVADTSARSRPDADDSGAGLQTTVPPRYFFPSPATTTLRERLDSLLIHFPSVPDGSNSKQQEVALATFQDVLKSIMTVGDAGRTFTEFAPLDKDLAGLDEHFRRFLQTENPRTLQERARISRRLAESIDFTSASVDDYRCGRAAWLVSAFWNSQLSRYWPASRPNVVYDFLGYLTTIQAELRYSDAEFLLLLRVSFSICRIASHDGLMPYQFLTTAADRLREWLQHTAGTILVSAGPGRVAPSRVPFDPRLDGERRDYAASLLELWRSESDRAAGATLMLEMGAWDPSRAVRLLAQLLPPEGPAFELWRQLIDTMAAHSRRVRVIRPNHWAPGASKPITVEREAVAILAADIVERHYRVLGGDISLKGHDFRDRRVPTFVCSAEFGPLGLFKLDAAERIGREVANFAKYAQRLHPRYRASRCDESKAVITEPDDNIQFVQGALTSYVFTEDETPRTLNAWFLTAPLPRTNALCTELFQRALHPWYGHATSTTIDVFGEFPIFNNEAISRLRRECKEHHDLDLDSSATDVNLSRAVSWLTSLLDYLDGRGVVTDRVAHVGSDLQVLRSHRSICHGDLHLDNILVVGKEGAEYPCIIDFEATHEGHVLKDFGRFVGAVVTRTFEWSDAEHKSLLDVLPPILLDWGLQPSTDGLTQNAQKVCGAVVAARAGILRAWQAGSYPQDVELVAALVASFLPFARYPDTRVDNARLCLELSSKLVGVLGE